MLEQSDVCTYESRRETMMCEIWSPAFGQALIC
jgi:hypothetical protein